jgi:hypothetical protein
MNSYTETAARQTPTLSGELDRLLALCAQIESADSQIAELGSRLTGPYPARGGDNGDKEPYGDLQRLQVIVDRLLSAQSRVFDGISHVRVALYGDTPQGLVGATLGSPMDSSVFSKRAAY